MEESYRHELEQREIISKHMTNMEKKIITVEAVKEISDNRVSELRGLKKYAREQFLVGIIEAQIKYWTELPDQFQNPKDVKLPSDKDCLAEARNVYPFIDGIPDREQTNLRMAFANGANFVINYLTSGQEDNTPENK